MRQVYDLISEKQNNPAFLFYFLQLLFTGIVVFFLITYFFCLSLLFLLLFIYFLIRYLTYYLFYVYLFIYLILGEGWGQKLGLLMFWREVPFGAVTKYETLNL